jgi:transcriptional regulator
MDGCSMRRPALHIHPLERTMSVYVPPHFSEPRREALHDLIQANPLGILVTNGKGGLDANHIPFELDTSLGEFGGLQAHVARANPVWKEIATGDEVLVIFRGPDAYISPNWYPSKHDFHKQVPTWNYLVVHAHGRVVVRDDERYVRALVARLTRRHEAQQASPWKMSDSPREFIDAMVKAIVGIEVEITRLEGKFKLSQNKEVRDIRNVGAVLKANGESALGDAMLSAAAAKADAG